MPSRLRNKADIVYLVVVCPNGHRDVRNLANQYSPCRHRGGCTLPVRPKFGTEYAPCRHCESFLEDHAPGGACLFMPTKFDGMLGDELDRYGYKHKFVNRFS